MTNPKTEQEIRDEERQWVLACVKDWLEIKNENQKCDRCRNREPNNPYLNSSYTTSADVDHSSLLQRLLAGRQPTKLPPPRTYSYPNYPMAEGEVYVPFEFFKSSFHTEYDKENEWMVIDQTAWKVISKTEEEYILEYPDTKEQYRVRKVKNTDSQDIKEQLKRQDIPNAHYNTQWVVEKTQPVEYAWASNTRWFKKEHEKKNG